MATSKKASSARIQPPELEKAIKAAKVILLGVRPAAEFAKEHFSLSINIPCDDLEKRISRITGR